MSSTNLRVHIYGHESAFLAEVAAEDPIAISGITDAAKFILMLTMALGRLEAMAIIALLNPDIWRK